VAVNQSSLTDASRLLNPVLLHLRYRAGV